MEPYIDERRSQRSPLGVAHSDGYRYEVSDEDRELDPKEIEFLLTHRSYDDCCG